MPLDQPPSDASPVSSAGQKIGEELRMSFGEHIEDLRRRLIHGLIGVAVAACITFTFGFQIIAALVQPFVQALAANGFPAQVYVRDPTLGFGVYLQVSMISAVILASPWMIYQVWRFIVEGLYEHERRAVHLLAPFTTLMTVLGVLFAYYVLLPVSLLFFINFATLYPQIKPGNPNPLFRMLMGAEGVHSASSGPSGGSKAGSGSVSKGKTSGGKTAKAAKGTIGGGDGGAPRSKTLPVLHFDPAHPREGGMWINGRQGAIKAFFNGRVHVMTIASSRMLAPLPEIGEYVKFAALMGLGIVIAFQLPVVMLVLGWTGMFDPAWIARFRKYAVFGCGVVGAVLTPTDVFSMMCLSVPLYGLFELGLVLMRLTYRHAGPDEPGVSDDDAG